MSWEDAWRQGRTGWDRGLAAPPLIEFLASTTLTPARALVPGCGAGYDVIALAHAGWDALGVDIAPTAVTRFEEVLSQAGAGSGRAQVACADFFSDQALDERFGLIWDYTFLCAIEPELRERWAKRMSELISPDGELVTLLFPVDIQDATPSVKGDPGPPYRLHPQVAQALLEPYFERVSLTQPTHSHADRVGKEWLARWRPKA